MLPFRHLCRRQRHEGPGAPRSPTSLFSSQTPGVFFGSPVNGGQVFGTFPSLKLGQDQYAGSSNRGRWIPTTAVDQYAAVAANRLGVSSGDIGTIFPNLGRFNAPFGTGANLAFV